MAGLFISYANEDAAAASRLASALDKEGHDVWLDQRIVGGTEFSREIERALDASAKVIVLWSAHSVGSAWVRDEAEFARVAGKLVPAALDGTMPPLGFRQLQTIDLSPWVRDAASHLPHTLLGSLLADGGKIQFAHEHSQSKRQTIAFCHTADGVTLAYGQTGSGSPLVKTANWLNHLEHEWENPLWRHWIEELSAEHTLLRYDERGNGMSDWNIPELSFELLVDDLRSVVDAAALHSFDLVAISQGCPVAVAFAARHPDRVRRLVLINGFAAGWRHLRDQEQLESWKAICTLVKTGWGKNTPTFRQIFTSQFFPDATREQAEWWNDLQKKSASPENAFRFMQLFGDINVLDQLPKVRVPTMVMHCRDDQLIPFEAGRVMAARIPGAKFVTLNSRNHLPLPNEIAWATLRTELHRFLSSAPSS